MPCARFTLHTQTCRRIFRYFWISCWYIQFMEYYMAFLSAYVMCLSARAWTQKTLHTSSLEPWTKRKNQINRKKAWTFFVWIHTFTLVSFVPMSVALQLLAIHSAHRCIPKWGFSSIPSRLHHDPHPTECQRNSSELLGRKSKRKYVIFSSVQWRWTMMFPINSRTFARCVTYAPDSLNKSKCWKSHRMNFWFAAILQRPWQLTEQLTQQALRNSGERTRARYVNTIRTAPI